MSELIISVSGLRGVVGDSLTPEAALRYVAAFAHELATPGPIVLTRDGRATGRMIADLVRGALCAAGRDVIDADIAATPTTGVLVRRYQAAGGIQVSASHNPLEYNGLKLFDPVGQVLTAAAGRPILERYREFTEANNAHDRRRPAWVGHQRVGRVTVCADTLSDHLGLVAATVDVERIRANGFTVLLDANHGAGSILGRRLLESLGCRVVLMGGEPDGRFAHRPEPTAENLVAVAPLVRQHGAIVGFCQDPDADRLAVIDEAGTYLGEEYTLALCLDHVLSTRSGPVAINCATSRMSADVAARHGAACYRAAVGEANVVAEMRARQAVFGGEGNGGPIDPRVGYVRDSFVGMALILDSLAQRQIRLSEWVRELPRYAIRKTTVPVASAALRAAFEALRRRFPEASVDLLDGMRLDWPDRWLLVRASNTEPIVRLIVEASDPSDAEQLRDDAANTLAQFAA